MLKVKLNKITGHRAYLDGVLIAKFESYEEVAIICFFWDIYKEKNHE